MKITWPQKHFDRLYVQMAPTKTAKQFIKMCKCSNAMCLCKKTKYIYIYILVFQISDWCLLFWESDGSNYSNLLIVIKRTDERPQYWFVFLSIAMFGLGNVIVKRKCLAFFTGSSRNNLSHRFSSLSLSLWFTTQKISSDTPWWNEMLWMTANYPYLTQKNVMRSKLGILKPLT